MSGAIGSGIALSSLGLDLTALQVQAAELNKMDRIRTAKQTTTICCYCSVGCGLICSVDKMTGKIFNIEGDPDHPINEGSLCAKGAGFFGLTEANEHRLRKVLYRAPKSDKWEEKDWDWTLKRIARLVKDTRDADFQTSNDKGQLVNRVESIGHYGSSNILSEECWTLTLSCRAMGLVYIDHQARVCHSPSVAGLAESFGRGSMTNHYIDLKNSNCILIMGGNPAENHPIAFKWILRAKDRGAKIIHVDPRFTRTSARCDYHVPLRSGTDIAFLGGMIKHIIDNNMIQEEYVKYYTNASQIVGPDFTFNDGLFSGYSAEKRGYIKETWTTRKDEKGIPVRDYTLQDPNCVYQVLKRHYDRYTLDKVSSITGVSKENLLKVYNEFGATGAKDKAGTECYALGWTQHTVGSQNIRAMSIIQLLLGNMGICGGGINALRGEPNVQGSTDHAILYNILPGYLKMPSGSIDTLAKYNEKYTSKSSDPQSANWYQNYPKYTVSFLKAMWGDKATAENDFGYSWLPKIDDGKHYSTIHLFDKMYEGKIKGFFAYGSNVAVSTPNTTKVRKGLQKLKWMVNVNLFNNESASFWKGPGVDPKTVDTEVFLLPAAAIMEKEGSQSNSGRWVQWAYKAANPPGDALSDGDITMRIMDAVRELYQKEGGACPEPILNLKWDYRDSLGRFNAVKCAKQINGHYTRDLVIEDPTGKAPKEINLKGETMPTFAKLMADGSTSSGNWIMAGSFDQKGFNKMQKRGKEDPTGLGLYPEWAFAWPVNRRIIYNRASCDLNGKPYNPKMKLLEWVGDKWVGDVPDGPWPPMADKEKGKYPFIMKADGVGALFGPGMVEGPFPEHYEPLEGPLAKNPLSAQLNNPTIAIFKSDLDKVANADQKFPYVCTTYSTTEHWCTGFTRWQPWLLEMQPEAYLEISEQLAASLGIKNGEVTKVSSARGSVLCVAMVTKRMTPFTVEGKVIHQVGIPCNYGWLNPEKTKDDSVNHLTIAVGDANTFCPEYKAFMVNVSKA
jgi:formate dehydrogenase major subunit